MPHLPSPPVASMFRRMASRKSQTAWINVVAWGAIAERVANFCKKGTFVYVHGSLNTRSYDDDSGQRHWIMEVVADIVADPQVGRGQGVIRRKLFRRI